jgi:hypothetical protein
MSGLVRSDPVWANARAAIVSKTKIPVAQKNLDGFTVLLLSFDLMYGDTNCSIISIIYDFIRREITIGPNKFPSISTTVESNKM